MESGAVTIADNGPGIPEDNRAQIFERGWTDTSDGTGMGLYIVKRLVENYGGQIRLSETAEDDDMNLGGATFVVELPTVAD